MTTSPIPTVYLNVPFSDPGKFAALAQGAARVGRSVNNHAEILLLEAINSAQQVEDLSDDSRRDLIESATEGGKE